MTYAQFLRGYVGRTGGLETNVGSWIFTQKEGGRDVLSAVHEGFVIVSKPGTDISPGNHIYTIPLTLFTLNSKKPTWVN